MTIRNNKKIGLFALLLVIGVMARFFVMTLGHNWDFESYCIVGEIAGNFRNVYAETYRYNYGPIFLCIQGLFYRISRFFPDWEQTYRVLLVSTLTLADLGICLFIYHKSNAKKALLFFLNPVSIIITGYHNQFDNIAVFLALMSILYYNEDEKFGKRDLLFIVYLALSLMMKHILLIFPFYILIKKGGVPPKKRILYSIIPPAVFLVSFLPFALQSKVAFDGILNNVFLYKSFENSPLLSFVYKFTGFPVEYSRIVFGIGMIIVAFLVRTKEYDKILYIYLIAMVSLSSAIVNQYLIIPIAAIVLLEKGVLKYIYLACSTVYLVLEESGLGFLSKLPSPETSLFGQYVSNAYTILAWILFIILILQLIHKDKDLMSA